MEVVHILNGDSLKARWPTSIHGEVIVARECLIDGDVSGSIHSKGLPGFYTNRAKFLECYPQCSATEYFLKSVPEFTKITKIPPNTIIYCWFEEDLFCQVNFWFVIALLKAHNKNNQIYLVKPNKGNEYSFANMDNAELTIALNDANKLTHEQLNILSQLWHLYQRKNYAEMLVVAQALTGNLTFVINAIKAQQARMPDESGYGYPERQLIAIAKELNTTKFAPVFQVFSQRMGIYSFGDLQVKRMFDGVLLKIK